jgi:hypothetical protein
MGNAFRTASAEKKRRGVQAIESLSSYYETRRSRIYLIPLSSVNRNLLSLGEVLGG